jgi:xanthine/CO dehydrogenase XdhC/CoxF family maturation factor
MTLAMALPFASAEVSAESTPAAIGRAARDPRALRILAKSIYRDLRGGGLAEEDVMAIAGDLLGLIAGDVKDRRRVATDTAAQR